MNLVILCRMRRLAQSGRPRSGVPLYKDRVKDIGIGALGLLVLTLAAFSTWLFLVGRCGASGLGSDSGHAVSSLAALWLREIARGNLPTPDRTSTPGPLFLAVSSRPLLYPLNVLYLVLPLAKAVNWGIALHAFLGGSLLLSLGIKRRPAPAGLASWRGAEFIFLRTLLSHIYAGHLPNLCTMIWAPLLVSGH